ncbi:transposase [Roseomonas mucosa]|nr:transposase [Roseomonas mucosa]
MRAACATSTDLRNVPDQCKVALVEPFPFDPARTGRPRSWPMRLLLDAILYVLRTGCT